MTTKPPTPGWSPPPEPEAVGEALLLWVDDDDHDFARTQTVLSPSYQLVRARGAEDVFPSLGSLHRRLSGVVVAVDLPGSVLGGPALAAILKGECAPPSWAGALPALDLPVVMLASPQRAGSVEPTARLVVRPVDLAAVTLALADWLLERRVRD